MIQPFHLAVTVHDLAKAREFYGKFLGFVEGRSNERWIDWNFFGHQLVTHLDEKKVEVIARNPVDGHGFPVLAQHSVAELKNKVDGKEVPVPHFGVVLEWQQWHEFADKIKAAKIKFVIEPYIRFRGATGEQATMFFLDPSGNALEFKAFKDISQLFAK